MNHSLYQTTEQFVVDSFTYAGKEGGLLHLRRTVYWMQQLKPDADEYMLIAAISHDIERASRNEEKMNSLLRKGGFKDIEFLRIHQEKGAEIVGEFLHEQGVNPLQITHIKELISHHEIGGTEEQNLLKDVDSISFFENNITHFIQRQLPLYGIQKVQEKFDWMYNRITLKNAKQIVEKWYRKAVHDLIAKV